VLLLGIWWPRCSVWGALTAMGIGFVTFLVGLIVGSLFSGSPSVTTATVSVVSMVLAFAGGIAVSLYGPAASAAQEAYWEEMRNPEGEAIFDRAQQRAAAAAATTSGK
ncbi:MAG: hypothetical protein ACREDO_03095, partial [Methyloceanibacter sp.]